VADDLDDLDEAEGDPQPPQGRELVIVDLGHTTMMTGAASEVEEAQEDKQNDRRYPKAGERPDRDRTGRPGRSPANTPAAPEGFPAGAARASGSCWPGSGLGQQLLQEYGPSDEGVAALADAGLDWQVQTPSRADRKADVGG
jgi:hypothetical protein